MIETCLDTSGMDWILCHNTTWHRATCTLLNRPVLPLCFRLCVLLVSSLQLRTSMTPGTVWFWICRQVSWHAVSNTISHLKFPLEYKGNRFFLFFFTRVSYNTSIFLCFLTLVAPGRETWAGLRRTGRWGCLDGSYKKWRSCRSIRSDCPERTSRNSFSWTMSIQALKNKQWRYKQPYWFWLVTDTVLLWNISV